MKVIAIVSQKGGAGKTTLALNLTVAAESVGLRAALTASGLDVLDQSLGHRAAFVHALTMEQGVLEFEPKGKASAEVHALYEALAGAPAFDRRASLATVSSACLES